MKTFFKFYNFLLNNEKNRLKFIFFITSIVFILEFISISSLPIFFGLVTEQKIILEKFNEFLLFFQLENILSKNRDNLIIYLGLIVFIIFLIKNLIMSFLLIYENKYYETVRNRLTSKLYEDFLNSDLQTIVNYNPSNISRTSILSVNEAFLYIQSIIGLYKEILTIFALFLILYLINPTEVLIIFAFFSLVAFTYYKILKPFLITAGEKNQLLLSKIFKNLNETFGMAKELKILDKDQKIREKFMNDIKNYNRNIFYFNTIQKYPKILLEVIFLTILLVLITSLLLKNKDFISFMPEIAAYTIVGLRFIPAFNSISSNYTYLQIGEASVNTIHNDIKYFSNFKENNLDILLNQDIQNSNKNYLSIHKLNYNHPNKNNILIEDFSASIKKGESIVITGSTGSGKSTFLHLLMGFLKPNSGGVYYLGKNINNKELNWIEKISFVSQTCYLLDDTIKNNIVLNFSGKKIDKEKYDKSIKLAQLGSFLKSLPRGDNSIIGNDGIKISGGERQRIAIARAIYKDSEIIFMDEFSSALDSITEEQIFNNIRSEFKNKTIISVSHRENIINKSEREFKIKNSMIVTNIKNS